MFVLTPPQQKKSNASSSAGVYGLLAPREVVDYARSLKAYIERVEMCPLRFHLWYAYLYSGHFGRPEKPDRTHVVESFVSAYISTVMKNSTFEKQKAISYIASHAGSEFHNSFKAMKRDIVISRRLIVLTYVCFCVKAVGEDSSIRWDWIRRCRKCPWERRCESGDANRDRHSAATRAPPAKEERRNSAKRKIGRCPIWQPGGAVHCISS